MNKVYVAKLGKSADFVILNQDLMKVSEEEILHTKVLETWIDGVQVYQE